MNIKSILNELDDELKGTFHTQETLEPKIWPLDKKLRPSTRKRLMEIAQDFYNSLETDAELKDVTFTGSLANYNWSKYSCLLYTSPSPRDRISSRMPSSA